MNKDKIIGELLVPIPESWVKLVGGAQKIDDKWYALKWGCETFEYLIEMAETEPLDMQ